MSQNEKYEGNFDSVANETLATAESERLLLAGYMVTTFLSAFLLFQVQPLISKMILPWFGGMSSVWTTCMLFFQVVLFLGYAYVHLTSIRMKPTTQMVLHIVILAGAVTFFDISPSDSWKPDGAEQPTFRILLLLGATVGFPFFILSTTGPLLQRWFSLSHRDRSPYRLFALSNAGSLIALISYPLVIEPTISTHTQAIIWSTVFFTFIVFCSFCAVRSWYLGKKNTIETNTLRDESLYYNSVKDELKPDNSPIAGEMSIWFLLAMVPSMMLLALTNQMCADISSVPFLWVFPLAIYLLSFILCFESDRWYVRGFFAILLPSAVCTLAWVMYVQTAANLVVQIAIYFCGLFVITMCCHGELAGLRPHPKYLTRFYLMISAGGAAGGIYVGAIAPLVHSTYAETKIGLFAVIGLMLTIYFHDKNWKLHNGRPRWLWGTIGVGVAVFSVGLMYRSNKTHQGNVTTTRNFYGVLRVDNLGVPKTFGHCVELWHGNIIHGTQFPQKGMSNQPTTYYGTRSGVGRVLNSGPEETPRRIGVVGLGTGTLAVYGRPGDDFRFYEINSEVIRLASKYFTYLIESQAEIDVVLGDARISLEQEEPQNFDVLVLDAFSSDSIPTHLLTSEAFKVYLKHLKEDGVVAIHISNKFIRLLPVVAANAHKFGLTGRLVNDPTDPRRGTTFSYWAIVSKNEKALKRHGLLKFQPLSINGMVEWTDDFSSLFELINY